MMRVGFGYDSHRFAAGRELRLGGVKIQYDKGLAGHSDADAVLHAVTDAILGAIGAGDIGEMFPDNDERYRDTDSSLFVLGAANLARQRGYRVVNCDITILAESPKLGPYKRAMQERIAELLGLLAADVGVKAKTNEGMGFVGRGEGLTAWAVVLLAREAS